MQVTSLDNASGLLGQVQNNQGNLTNNTSEDSLVSNVDSNNDKLSKSTNINISEDVLEFVATNSNLINQMQNSNEDTNNKISSKLSELKYNTSSSEQLGEFLSGLGLEISSSEKSNTQSKTSTNSSDSSSNLTQASQETQTSETTTSVTSNSAGAQSNSEGTSSNSSSGGQSGGGGGGSSSDEDFEDADTNQDGIVSDAEYEAYYGQSKDSSVSNTMDIVSTLINTLKEENPEEGINLSDFKEVMKMVNNETQDSKNASILNEFLS